MAGANTDVTLRRMTPADSALLAKLAREAFHDAYADTHCKANRDIYCRTYYREEKFRALLSTPGVRATLASIDNQNAGYSILLEEICPHMPRQEALELKQIYLLAHAYGSGLGELLLNDTINAAKAEGKQLLWLSVSDKNLRAQAFYRKHGFQQLGNGPEFEVGSDHLTSHILALTL